MSLLNASKYRDLDNIDRQWIKSKDYHPIQHGTSFRNKVEAMESATADGIFKDTSLGPKHYWNMFEIAPFF